MSGEVIRIEGTREPRMGAIVGEASDVGILRYLKGSNLHMLCA
jgi:hypothetical protein